MVYSHGNLLQSAEPTFSVLLSSLRIGSVLETNFIEEKPINNATVTSKIICPRHSRPCEFDEFLSLPILRYISLIPSIVHVSRPPSYQLHSISVRLIPIMPHHQSHLSPIIVRLSVHEVSATYHLTAHSPTTGFPEENEAKDNPRTAPLGSHANKNCLTDPFPSGSSGNSILLILDTRWRSSIPELVIWTSWCREMRR